MRGIIRPQQRSETVAGAASQLAAARERRMSLLRVEGLAKKYRSRQVVKDLSLEVARGEVVGLLGPNGAGKTTAFYMIVGLVPTDAGRIVSTARTSRSCRCTGARASASATCRRSRRCSAS